MEHIDSRRTYYKVFAGLIALTLLTVAVAYLDLGRMNVTVALGIATLKTVIVALFFMHVRHSSMLTKLVVSSGLVWFGILVLLAMSDYLTRGLLNVPGR
jgi:cytochrome c oxidase subunit IV